MRKPLKADRLTLTVQPDHVRLVRVRAKEIGDRWVVTTTRRDYYGPVSPTLRRVLDSLATGR